MKNNCYTCEFRGSVPGDAHSCCRHPDLKGVTDDPISGLIEALSSAHRIKSAVQAVADKFRIQANYHGIKQGWFYWPWNFDPVWLENCNAYKRKESA